MGKRQEGRQQWSFETNGLQNVRQEGPLVNAKPHPHGRRRRLFGAPTAIASTLVLATALVASSVAASDASTRRSTTSATVKLTFMSNAQSAGIETAWKELIAAYEKLNPTVTITRTPVAFAAYDTTAKLRASSSSPPDLIEGGSNPGGTLATLAKSNLLLPVDKYAVKYQWKKKFGPLLRQLRISKDGKSVGSGNLVGVPDFAEVIGVFYNKSLLAKLKLKQPTTFAEFEASLQAAKDANITPLMIGGLDKWPWVHTYDILANLFDSPANLTNWYNGKRSATVVNSGMTKAGAVLQQWVESGYYEDGANGVSDGDAVARFGKGLSLYKVDGPWETEVNSKALGKNLGFFLLPSPKAGVRPPSTGSMGWDVGITAKSKNPDAAATFLNFLTTDAARAIIMKHQNPPGAPGPVIGLGKSPVLGTIVSEYSRLLREGKLVTYLDAAYPGTSAYDFYSNVQSMAAGKMSPSDLLKKTQAGWAAFHNYK
jgi:raffinose/stachyose/melibiose transport system substrate-binding protein